MDRIYTSADIAGVWGRVFRLLDAELAECEVANKQAIELDAGPVTGPEQHLIQRLDTASRNLARFTKLALDEAENETPSDADNSESEGAKLARLRIVG